MNYLKENVYEKVVENKRKKKWKNNKIDLISEIVKKVLF